MQKLFESFRKFTFLSEEQLLVEGRIDDAAKKYPELAKKYEELDGESLLDTLIAADPSGNQKYLMGAARLVQGSMKNAEEQGYKPFWGKLFPADVPHRDNIYSPWGQAKNIADLLPKYHSLMPFIRDHDARFRDINNIKTYTALRGVVAGAENVKAAREAAKERKKQEAAIAKKTTEFIDDNDYHKVIRPLSEEASCYFGKSTTWCISATRSRNYFQDYTRDGLGFLFLLAKNKDVASAYKTIAMVFNRDGDIHEVLDAENETLQGKYLQDVIRHTMIGETASGAMVSYEEGEDYDEKAIYDALEPFKGIGGFDYDENDDIGDIIGLFDDTIVDSYMRELEAMGAQSLGDTPPGPSEEEYQELLDMYDFDHMHVTFEEQDYPGGSYHWYYNFGIDVEDIVENNTQRLKWKVKPEDVPEDIMFNIVQNALHDNSVYPEDMEQDWSNNLIFNASSQWGRGSPDDFDRFLDETNTEDKNIEGVSEDILEAMVEEGLLGRDTREEEYWPDPEVKKKQQELPLQESRKRIRVRIRR